MDLNHDFSHIAINFVFIIKNYLHENTRKIIRVIIVSN